MTTKIFALSSAVAAATALVASPLAAHPGDHGGMDVNAFVAHFAQEPFHVGGLVLAVVAAGYLVLRFRKAKSRHK